MFAGAVAAFYRLVLVFFVLTGTTVAFTTGTAFATGTIAFTTGATVATGAVAFTTRTTFAAWFALGLYPAFGLGQEGTHRQAVFAGLGVDLDEFDLYLVAFLQTACSHVLEALPCDLTDMEKTVAVGHKLYECDEDPDRAYGAFV